MKQPAFETTRLKFRPVTAEDVDFFYQLDSNPNVMKYINGGTALTKQEVEAYVPKIIARDKNLNGRGIWLAFTKDTDEFVGWFGLKPLPHNPED